jgi:hypothetical protein
VHGNMEIQEIKRKNRNHVKDIRGKEKKWKWTSSLKKFLLFC